MEKKVWRIIDVVNWATDYFTSKEIESPRLNIELMLCSVLNISRIDVYTLYEKPLAEFELINLRNMIIQRADGIPLQYVLGKTSFFGFDVLVNDSVMIPRPETELLVKHVLDDINKRKTVSREQGKGKNISILDIGTGSGCIALVLAIKLPLSQVLAIDNSYFALLTAKNNASNLAVKNIYFNQCDILREIPSQEKFDIVVSNPPYIPLDDYNKLDDGVRKFEPKAALTDENDGLTYYKRFSEIITDLLKPDGVFYFEIGYGQSEKLKILFESISYSIEFFNDLSMIPRIIKGYKYNPDKLIIS